MEDSSRSIDKYEIIETVLKSAEGIIYRVTDTTTSTRVILKKYYPTRDWSDEVLNDFFNLFSYLRFIEHESLLPILDVGKHENKPYVVFADNGLTLLCDRLPGQIDQQEMLGFLSGIAEGLDFLHKQEILHGGLGTQNIAIDADGYPLLFDFGLSEVSKKLLLENMDDGFENLSVMDLKYTSPEQIRGRTPTRASDIYAFGVISYFYLFGELPFRGEYVAEIATSVLKPGVIQIIKPPEGVARSVIQLIQKCIQVNPEARFASFGQILKSIEMIKSGQPVRLKFQERLAVQGPRIRLSPAFMGASLFVLAIAASSYMYLQKIQATAQAQMTATANGLVDISVTRPSEVPTQTATAETPTQTETISPTATQVETDFKLAFEGQKPFNPTKLISNGNLSNLQEISRLGYGKPEEVDVAPDNNHVAVATSAGVAIFEGNQFLKWIDLQGWVTSVEFSPDGKTLAIGLATGEIQLWDWNASVKTTILSGHTARINRMLFSSNGLLFSASADRNIMIWNPKSGSLVKTIPAHSQPVNDIAVTTDSRILISCSDDRLIRVWDVNSGNKIYELNSQYFTGAIRAIALSSDDVYLAAGGDAGYLYQWNFLASLSTANPLPSPRNNIVPVQDRIWSLEYIRDDKELLVGVDSGKSVTYDATRKDYEGISYSFKLPAIALDVVDVFGPRFSFDSFSVFRDGSVISVNWDGQVKVQEDQLITPMYDILDRLDFSPDGTILAAGGRRGSTHVWDLTSNQFLYKNLYFLPFGDPISPDGKAIALLVPKVITLSSGNTLNVDNYQLKSLSGTPFTRDLSEALPDANVGYSSNGSIFIAANMKQSKAWDVGNGSETRLKGYAYTGCWVTASANDVKEKLQVNSVAGLVPLGDDEHINNLCPKSYASRSSLPAFSRDLSLLVYIDSNGSLARFDVLKKAAAWPPYQLKDLAKVTVLAVSPDSSVIVVGHETGKISFFNGRTGEFLSDTIGNFGTVRVIQFSEDGTKFATAGDDGLVRVFGIVDIP